MVMYALAVMLLPLAMAGMVYPAGYNQVTVQVPGQAPVQQQWVDPGWVNSGWGNSGWGVQVQQPQQQQQQNNPQWWGMSSQEEYDAYLQWCEERRLGMEEQKVQQELLHQVEQRAEERKHAMEREKAQKEMKMKRETMMAQWRMWNAQLAIGDEFTGHFDQFAHMKIGYMFHLTMEFLKFCHCSDYTAHLQRYLVHEGKSYEPATSDAYDIGDLDRVEISSGVESVAQRLAALSEAEQAKLYFGGIIGHMCGEVKVYVEQVKGWESQFNFMGI